MLNLKVHTQQISAKVLGVVALGAILAAAVALPLNPASADEPSRPLSVTKFIPTNDPLDVMSRIFGGPTNDMLDVMSRVYGGPTNDPLDVMSW